VEDRREDLTGILPFSLSLTGIISFKQVLDACQINQVVSGNTDADYAAVVTIVLLCCSMVKLKM